MLFASSSPRSRKKWFLYGSVGLLLGGAIWYFGFRPPAGKAPPPHPAWAGAGWPQKVPVKVVAAAKQDLPVYLRAVGTVTALNTVTLRSRVEGQLLRIAFTEGQRVQEGDLLAEIDPAPYRARVAQAEGQLQQAAARLSSARSDLERTLELHARNLVTNQDLDLQKALVAEREGATATARAALENAKLDLGYTRIVAPLSGRVGLRRVDPGNLVRTGDTNGLFVLTQTSPIAVTFTVPESELASVVDPFRAGEPLVAEAWDRAEDKLLATGTLKNIDNQIDTATGTLRLRAEFANEDERLFPNQFINLRLRVRTLAGAIVIPSAAIQFGARGTYVYVVDANSKAVIRDLVLGPVEGSLQAIRSGLEAGDRVVLEGLDRLREGSEVVIAETPTSAPKP